MIEIEGGETEMGKRERMEGKKQEREGEEKENGKDNES